MTAGAAISTCFRNYAGFSGRATRSEFWWFVLFVWAVLLVSSIIGNALPRAGRALPLLWLIATLLPVLAVTVRRLHDTGKPSWVLPLALAPSGILAALTVRFWREITAWLYQVRRMMDRASENDLLVWASEHQRTLILVNLAITLAFGGLIALFIFMLVRSDNVDNRYGLRPADGDWTPT